MSVLVTYFAAPSDDRAAATIDLRGGPAADTPRRGLRRSSPGLPALDAPGIDPFIALGMFEEFLTGVTWEAQQTDAASRAIVAERDGGEAMVVRVGPRLVTATVDATDASLQAVVAQWEQIEEFDGAMDTAVLTDFAVAFRALCGGARDRGDGVYCWQVV